mmetsp:Transcript_34875/g.76095  ORF Transcript_34875/g.76095 Transcript_34875/m.76095 type:complete len:365 (+) Transcript_34875:533-1627(+)
MTQVGDVAVHPELVGHALRLCLDDLRIGIEDMGIKVPLKCLVGALLPCSPGRCRPAHTNHIKGTVIEDAHLPILREDCHQRFRALALHLRCNVLEVLHAEVLIDTWRDLAAVRVEHCEQRRPSVVLTNEVLDDDLPECFQKPPRLLGIQVQPLLRTVEAADGAALDHVTHQRPGRTGKSDDRHLVVDALPRPEHGVKNVAQGLLDIGREVQLRKILWRLNGKVKLRANRRHHLTRHPHGRWHHQNVREDDQGVQAGVASERLQRDLGCQGGGLADREEVGVLQQRHVLGQVSARLSHHPLGRPVIRLATSCPQQTVVLWRWPRCPCGPHLVPSRDAPFAEILWRLLDIIHIHLYVGRGNGWSTP